MTSQLQHLPKNASVSTVEVGGCDTPPRFLPWKPENAFYWQRKNQNHLPNKNHDFQGFYDVAIPGYYLVHICYCRWWFQICLFFHPGSLGKIPILTNIFQGGWFNHQPVWAYQIRSLRLWKQTRFPAVQAKEALGQFADGSTGLLESEILLLQVGESRVLGEDSPSKKHSHDVVGTTNKRKHGGGSLYYIIYIHRGL